MLNLEPTYTRFANSADQALREFEFFSFRYSVSLLI